jgi:hypothetical protein
MEVPQLENRARQASMLRLSRIAVDPRLVRLLLMSW